MFLNCAGVFKQPACFQLVKDSVWMKLVILNSLLNIVPQLCPTVMCVEKEWPTLHKLL